MGLAMGIAGKAQTLTTSLPYLRSKDGSCREGIHYLRLIGATVQARRLQKKLQTSSSWSAIPSRLGEQLVCCATWN